MKQFIEVTDKYSNKILIRVENILSVSTERGSVKILVMSPSTLMPHEVTESYDDVNTLINDALRQNPI